MAAHIGTASAFKVRPSLLYKRKELDEIKLDLAAGRGEKPS